MKFNKLHPLSPTPNYHSQSSYLLAFVAALGDDIWIFPPLTKNILGHIIYSKNLLIDALVTCQQVKFINDLAKLGGYTGSAKEK